mmetsp:Transcript_119036/g.379630  ORF Transcript_119036/g.379630 Transcript_119036/m.379630 type:complete len:208 (+) Transcript_119036:3801-4424(+)
MALSDSSCRFRCECTLRSSVKKSYLSGRPTFLRSFCEVTSTSTSTKGGQRKCRYRKRKAKDRSSCLNLPCMLDPPLCISCRRHSRASTRCVASGSTCSSAWFGESLRKPMSSSCARLGLSGSTGGAAPTASCERARRSSSASNCSLRSVNASRALIAPSARSLCGLSRTRIASKSSRCLVRILPKLIFVTSGLASSPSPAGGACAIA